MNNKEETKNENELLEIGSIFLEKYKIVGKIGEGGMGVVYKGEHILINKPVAIKILYPHLSLSEEVVLRFLREAQAAANLSHPNICQAIDFGEIKEKALFYMVMEYLDGKTLEELLREKGRFQFWELIPILIQICKGLKFAHDRGVIHRDLKPENIMVIKDSEGNEVVKILDFGIARLTQRADSFTTPSSKLTRAGFIVGTPQYISPEQAMGEEVDHRSDIYSLGVIIYELLTGRRPFQSENPIKEMGLHITQPPPPFVKVIPGIRVPPFFEKLVFQMLEKDPNKRPSSVDEILWVLEKKGVVKLKDQFLRGLEQFLERVSQYIDSEGRWWKLIFIGIALVGYIYFGLILSFVLLREESESLKSNLTIGDIIIKLGEKEKDAVDEVIDKACIRDEVATRELKKIKEIKNVIELTESGHLALATQLLDSIREKNRDKEELWRSLNLLGGYLLLKKDDLKGAIKYYSVVLRENPKARENPNIKELVLKGLFGNKWYPYNFSVGVLQKYYNDDREFLQEIVNKICNEGRGAPEFVRKSLKPIFLIDKGLEKVVLGLRRNEGEIDYNQLSLNIDKWCIAMFGIYTSYSCKERKNLIEYIGNNIKDKRIVPVLEKLVVDINKDHYSWEERLNLCIKEELLEVINKINKE